MAGYKTLYFQLFSQITRIIEELQQIQQDAEDLYLAEDGPELEEEERL